MLELILTREDANTESAILVEWLVADRALVRRHELVCVVETTKASLELESPGEGTLVHLYAEGAEVELGERIAVIAETDDELREAAAARTPPPAATGGQTGRRATRKAADLAAAHGIDLAAVEKQGFITAADVEALIEPGRAVGPEPAGNLLDGVSMQGVTLPISFGLDPSVGVLDAALLTSLRADEDAFRALSSEEKCAVLREHGAVVGDGVVLGEEALIVAPRVVLEDGVRLGAGATVRCADIVAIGKDTAFGPKLEISCRRAFLGAGIWGGRSVRFGGGGHRDPWAILVVGDLAFVGDEVFVNVCRPVLIGAETFVTMRSMIVTHNIGHSVLEGYENRFAPVVLEDRAQLGLGSVVYAGCRIGRGAIVASSSYVISDIPADALAIGVPAKVAGPARRTLSRSRREELVREMVDELRELLVLGGHAVSPLADSRATGLTIATGGGSASVSFVPRFAAGDAVARGEAETVILTLELLGDAPADVSVFDLTARCVHGGDGPLHESVREFCRKRGIRFTPGPWRYLGGLL